MTEVECSIYTFGFLPARQENIQYAERRLMMLDQAHVIFFTLQGKLHTDSILKRYFWVFVASLGLTWLLLAYNAFMSLQFYTILLGQYIGVHSLILAGFVTGFLSLTNYFFISAWIGSILKILQKEKAKDVLERIIFIALTISLSTLVSLDIYANLHGVEKVASITLEQIDEHSDQKVFDQLQLDIAQKDSLLAQLITCKIKGYCWYGRLTEAGIAFQEAISKDIAALRSQQALFTQQANLSHQHKQAALQQKIAVKQKTHTGIVWFAYPMTLLLCLIVQSYTTRALAYANSAKPTLLPHATSESTACKDAFDQSFQQLPTLDPDTAYLGKWQEAVDLIIAGKTNREVVDLYEGPEGQIRGTTIQKLKTVLRAKGKLPAYHN